ncbi:hypothetical protein LCGC14_0947180 [marine sediment metagenome]|uniref:Uncharacterized protein n=1 Tax=marine sediment metagenome TaxID=412755 RepID=A0A0F9NN52_9ZZZZ
MSFKIDKSVIMPPGPYLTKYNFAALRVNEGLTFDDYKQYRLAVRAAHEFSRRHRGVKFCGRWNGNEGTGRVVRYSPKIGRPKFGTKKYPFNEMEIGDSIAFKGKKTYNMAKNAASTYGKYNNLKFRSRWLGDLGRIWRIK